MYSLASRFPRDLNKRIGHALKGVSSDCEFLMSIWPIIEWRNKIQRQIIIALFLLEELELRNLNKLKRNLAVTKSLKNLLKQRLKKKQTRVTEKKQTRVI